MDPIESEGTSNANILRQHFEGQSLNPANSLETVEHGQSIIIVGAGAFGSSLALELVTYYRHKYVSVDVFDKWPVPSRDAASTDTTKIIRADYIEPIYAKIASEAVELWKTDLYKGTYHQTGWIFVNDEKDHICSKTLDTLEMNGLAEGIIKFKSGKEITKIWEVLDGPMEGSVGYFNPTSGWANAAQATYRVASAAQTLGAKFHSGTAGEVTFLLYNSSKTKIIGIQTRLGSIFHADKVVLCTGARTSSLIDTKGQLIPKGHCLAHIQLTPEEHSRYADIPVFDDSKWDIYYFPPFKENGVMKIATLGSGYQIKGDPRMQSDNPEDGIPKEAEEHLRRGMRASIPSLAEREMFDVRICWCVDTPDAHFLITPYPDVAGLYLATGGSAHGFKFLPRIGHYIALMLEDELPVEFGEKWKWRPEQKWKEIVRHERTLVGKDLEEAEGWKGSARHGPMAHTWGNS